MKSKRKKIIISISCFALILVFLVLPFVISIAIYNSNFGNRYETISWMARSIEEFDGLKAEQNMFGSNKNQLLAGYTYYKEGIDPKGVIIIAHGLGGGGQNHYMDVADYFTTNGYLVFAYDATGNDKSEGDCVEGIPQGEIDLDHAIRFIKECKKFEGMPIMLFGHSWGAYSVGSVLNLHPDIKSIVMIAGFNKSIDIIEEEGKRIAGDGISLLLPYISAIEKIKFGSYAGYNCIEGINKSGAGAMIIHSEDDKMVSFENQYLSFYKEFKDNSKVRFVKYEDRGHDYVYYTDASRQYKNKLNKEFKAYVDSLDTELTPEIKTEYMNKHLDKKQLFELDNELMSQIVSFYDSYSK